jgi:FtsZ-binding cell division protein ZapB
MQALSDWLVANDVDMKLPDECGDPADAAALIQSLQLAVERWKTEAADYAEEVGCRRGEIEELQDQLTAAQRVKDEAVEALRWIENLPSIAGWMTLSASL